MIFHWKSCDPEDMVSLDATLRQFSFECKMKFTSVEEKLQINGTSFREALEIHFILRFILSVILCR